MERPEFFRFLGFTFRGLVISESLITSVFVSLLLIALAMFLKTRLSEEPTPLQSAIEGVYLAAHSAVEEMVPTHTKLVFPFVAALWVYILSCNLIGLVPGFSAPTADISVTSSLSVLVYLSVHWFGIKCDGWVSYFKHYLKPNPLLLPFHLISEVSRTIALAVRLFGNVMSLEMAAFLVLMVAGILVPIPLLVLHIVEAVIQAYLFGMLSLVYIAGGMQGHQLRKKEVING